MLIINTDGGSRGNPGPAGIGVVVTELNTQQVVFESSKYIGIATNNEAEYQAVVEACEWLQTQSNQMIKEVEWRLDSQLVVNQLNKDWKIKDTRMRQFAESIWQKLSQVKGKHTFKYVPRAQNAAADALVNQALDAYQE